MTLQTTRREFLQTTAAAGVGFWVAGGVSTSQARVGPNDRVNVAFVGVGGRGEGNLNSIAGSNIANVVALCDVDERRAANAFNRHANARRFSDFRRMLEQMRNDIDAVVVSTPDHTHAHPSIMAMRMGKHCYCEKPLTHSVWEARQMKLEAERNRVITQMGNQGTASNGLREGVEVIQSGAIGPVREVHVWTNRPIWPQSDIWQRVGGEPRNLDGQPVPQGLDWDVWQGPAPARPYNSAYLPFNWRGWWDYGTGAIGDMACHTMNLPFMALRLDAPTRVSAQIDDRPHNRNDQTPPVGCVVTYEFAARGDMPALTLRWYERNYPAADLLQGQQRSGSGCLLIGERGTMYSPSDYGGNYVLLPREQFQNYRAPERRLPRTGDHHREWLEGIRNNQQAMSNFNYASRLTETALLGNVAIRTSQPFRWNTEEMRCDNEQAQRYIRREYREGWNL